MLNLEIVTPEKKVVSESVESVTIPTASGEVGILTDHAPLISSLKPGILSYSKSGTTEEMVISGGFVEISGNNVSVLADIAEREEEIDIEAAKADKSAAENVLADWKDGSAEEFETENEKLERAQARLLISSDR